MASVYSCVTERDFLVGCDSGFVLILIQKQLSTLKHAICLCTFIHHIFPFCSTLTLCLQFALVCSVVARMLNCFPFLLLPVVYLLRFILRSFLCLVSCVVFFIISFASSNLFYINFFPLISFSLCSIALSFGAMFIPLSSYLKMQNVNK